MLQKYLLWQSIDLKNVRPDVWSYAARCYSSNNLLSLILLFSLISVDTIIKDGSGLFGALQGQSSVDEI